jgi:hypothetical protein
LEAHAVALLAFGLLLKLHYLRLGLGVGTLACLFFEDQREKAAILLALKFFGTAREQHGHLVDLDQHV